MTLWNCEQETWKLGLCHPILRRLTAECQSAQLYTLGALAPLQGGKLSTAYLAHRLQWKPLDGTQKATIWGSGKANKSRQSKRKPGLERWPPRGEVSHFIFLSLLGLCPEGESLSELNRGAAGRTAKTPQRCGFTPKLWVSEMNPKQHNRGLEKWTKIQTNASDYPKCHTHGTDPKQQRLENWTEACRGSLVRLTAC